MRVAQLAFGFLFCVASGWAAGEDQLKPDTAVVYKRIGDVELKLHVFNPPGHVATNRNPAIVFFFGGGWTGGSPTQFYPHCRYFASRGMVAMSAEYRVKSRNGTTPRECVKDAKSAIRWIRVHAAELGIDPDRLVAGGGSAGGHLAAATGTLPGLNEDGEDVRVSCRPNALILFNPVVDVGPGAYGHDRLVKYWEEISPLHHVDASTPPTIFFLGTKDALIPGGTAERFKKRMTDAGRTCELRLYEGQAHGFFNYEHREYYTATLREADQFLAGLGFLKGASTLPDTGKANSRPLKNP